MVIIKKFVGLSYNLENKKVKILVLGDRYANYEASFNSYELKELNEDKIREVLKKEFNVLFLESYVEDLLEVKKIMTKMLKCI